MPYSPYYKYDELWVILENKQKLHWDLILLTEKNVRFNGPDITNKGSASINVAVSMQVSGTDIRNQIAVATEQD